MAEYIGLAASSIVSELEKWLIEQLRGDAKTPGLYFAIARGVPTWDQYLKLVGTVQGYERALYTLQELRKQQGGVDLDEVVTFSRPGMN